MAMWRFLAGLWFRHFSTRRFCIFCGYTHAPLTNEHVVPKWIARHIKNKKSHVIYRSNQYTSRHTHQMIGIDITARVVCKTCNNELLSDFETHKAKPILSKLLDGRACQSKTTLDIRQQVILAAWMFRAVSVLEFAIPERRLRYFSQSQREAFRQTLKPPNRVWIWMAHYVGRRRYSLSISDSQLFDGLPFLSKRIHATIAIDHVAFQLIGVGPFEDPVIPSQWRDAVIQLFPYTGRNVVWPPPLNLDENGIDAFRHRWDLRRSSPE